MISPGPPILVGYWVSPEDPRKNPSLTSDRHSHGKSMEPHTDHYALAASIQEQIQQATYTSLPAYVILYYDYLLTLNNEIQFIWPAKKFTFSSEDMYYRCLPNKTRRNCRNLLKYHQYLAGLIQIVAGIALSCRTYALYGRRRRVLYPLTILGLVVIGFGLWALHSLSLSLEPNEQYTPTGCLLPLSQEDASHYAGAWIGMLLFDLTVFLMTVHKSISRWKEDEFHQDTTLLHILLRDGSIYFGVMVLLTLSVVVSFFIMPVGIHFFSDNPKNNLTVAVIIRTIYLRLSLYIRPSNPPNTLQFLMIRNLAISTPFTDRVTHGRLSSVMVSRLILNLRDPLITSNRNFRPNTLTTMMDTTFSLNDSECISNGEVLLQQLGGTPRYAPASPAFSSRSP
ncbi:hypothetical protein D9756_003156 [Leucocoprinus leucothites]|uniref:DUF6533 domain-containing protein n=1 Tax=Leucocoprinus leucothites TaxID=201217 RepID=A0A8H5G6G7_9AGAR|nr:hypothetical protein D9756_003156 [Leucoagaricus leucothites]